MRRYQEVNDTTVKKLKPLAAKKHHVVFTGIMDSFTGILVSVIRQKNYYK